MQKETVLSLKFIQVDGKNILHQKVEELQPDGTIKNIWIPIDGQEEKSNSSLSERFKFDTFKPHPYKPVDTTTIDKKLKLDINFNDESENGEKIKFHIERSMRIDNLLKKILKSPELIKKEGFDFRGNNELKKAFILICNEMGGEWTNLENYFK